MRTLSAASRTSAVSVRAAPEARLVVELVIVRWSAAPGTIVKVVASELSDPAVAVIVIEPVVWPAIESEATPFEAVAAPSPVTVPAPPVFANVTEVELSVVTTLPAASRTSAISDRAAPDARFAVELVTTTATGPPRTTVKRARVGGEAARRGGDGDRSCDLAGDALRRDARARRRGTQSGDGAAAGGLGEGDRGRAVVGDDVLPAASRTSAVRVRAVPAVRFAVELVIVRWSAAPGSMVKVVASAVSPAADAVIVIEPAGLAGDRLRCDTGGGGGCAEAGDGAGAGGLGEGDGGRVVAGEEVVVGVADLCGQRPRRAGGEVGGRAGDSDVIGCAGHDREGGRVGRESGCGGGDRDRAGESGGDRLWRRRRRRRFRRRAR